MDRHQRANGEGLLEHDQERRQRAHREPRRISHPRSTSKESALTKLLMKTSKVF